MTDRTFAPHPGTSTTDVSPGDLSDGHWSLHWTDPAEGEAWSRAHDHHENHEHHEQHARRQRHRRRMRRLRRTVLFGVVLAALVYGLTDDLLTQVRLHAREVQLTSTESVRHATARLLAYTENLLRSTIANRNTDQGTLDALSAKLASDQQQLASAKQGLSAKMLDLSTLNTCVTGVRQAVADTQTGNQQGAISVLSSVSSACENLQGNSPGGPVYPFDFPDPDVILVGATYYGYGTNSAEGNIQIISSTDLVHWSPVGNALPNVPSWASPGATWAPSVADFGGRYLLYYAVHAGSGECISVAGSASPRGPFDDSSPGPIVCQPTLGGSIDPSPYFDGAGNPYLTWKSNAGSGQPETIWAQPLAPSGTSTAPGSSPSALLQPTQGWEGSVVEAPDMWDDAGTYFLFYSGNKWDSSSYAEGVALCDGPMGPCHKPLDQPIYASQSNLVSPGGGSVFIDTHGNPWIAFHAYLPGAVDYPNARLLFLRRVVLTGGVVQVGAAS